MDPAFRESWRKEMLSARTLAGVATLVYSLVANAAGVLPMLQAQDKQEQALINEVCVRKAWVGEGATGGYWGKGMYEGGET